jgi:hypothetical protein
MKRSQTAFARGAWIGVFNSLILVLLATVEKIRQDTVGEVI